MGHHLSGTVFVLFLFSILTSAQVTIHIVGVSRSTPAGSAIFFAGTVNDWDPGDQDYRMDPQENGDYWIDLPPGSGQIEFKFTRGSWESVEGNENGGFRPNRTFIYGTADIGYCSPDAS
jgi:hypothetical protein